MGGAPRSSGPRLRPARSDQPEPFVVKEGAQRLGAERQEVAPGLSRRGGRIPQAERAGPENTKRPQRAAPGPPDIQRHEWGRQGQSESKIHSRGRRGQSDPRRGSEAGTEPISCEDRARGRIRAVFQILWMGEEQLCSASGERWAQLGECGPGRGRASVKKGREGGPPVRTDTCGASGYSRMDIGVSGQPARARWVRANP